MHTTFEIDVIHSVSFRCFINSCRHWDRKTKTYEPITNKGNLLLIYYTPAQNDMFGREVSKAYPIIVSIRNWTRLLPNDSKIIIQATIDEKNISYKIYNDEWKQCEETKKNKKNQAECNLCDRYHIIMIG